MKDFTDIQHHIEALTKWTLDFYPRLILAIITLFVGYWVVKFLNRMVHNFFLKKDYDLTLEKFLQSFISISLNVLLFVLVITELGVKSSSLVALVGAAGLTIGLALQGSLSNFAGGILILIFKPFKIGDFISAQGIDGTVKEISLFTTKLNTFGNQVAIIPNGQLSNSNIINYNEETTRRDRITVGIGYNSNIKIAKDILLDICNRNENILKEPAPEVYVGELADSAVNLSLRFWANNDVFWAAHFHVLEELKNKFDEAGIEIPFPQRVLHTKEERTS